MSEVYIKNIPYIINNPTEHDLPDIIFLYKQNIDTLGIPFNRVFTEMLQSKNFFVIKTHENKFVGFGGIKLKPLKKEIEIIHLCIDSKYRNKGIGTYLCYFLISQIVQTITLLIDLDKLNYPVVAIAKKGAKNNLFYSKISKQQETLNRKTTQLIKYYLDYKLIKERING